MKFEVVLFQPEIPQNTGSIGRLCVATQSTLHLIRPLGFDLSEKALRRAGLDYWKHLNVREYDSLEEYFETSISQNKHFSFFTKHAGKTLYDSSFIDSQKKVQALLFGKETKGLPDWVLNRYADRSFRIPMQDARVRSLNLAMSVGIALYEGLRRAGESNACV